MNKIIIVCIAFIIFLSCIQSINAASYSLEGHLISLSINHLRIYDLNFNKKCTINIYGIDFSNNVIPLFNTNLSFYTESIDCYYYLGKDINQIHAVVVEDGHISLDKKAIVYKNPYEFYNAQLLEQLYTKPFLQEFKKTTTITNLKKKILFTIFFITAAILLLFKIKSKYISFLMVFMFLIFLYVFSTIGIYDYYITIKGKLTSTEFEVSQYLEKRDSQNFIIIEKTNNESGDYRFTATSLLTREGKYRLSDFLLLKPIIFNTVPLIVYDESDYYITFNKNLQWWIANDKE